MTTFNYCPRCGSELKPEDRDRQNIPVCRNKECKFEFWPVMHPAVSVMIRDNEGLVLTTTRGIEPKKGMVEFPGGFLRLGELPEEAARREVKEEVGVEIEVDQIFDFGADEYLYQGLVQINLVIGVLARIVSGEPRVADEKEVTDFKWQRPEDIDLNSLAFDCERRFVKQLLKRIKL